MTELPVCKLCKSAPFPIEAHRMIVHPRNWCPLSLKEMRPEQWNLLIGDCQDSKRIDWIARNPDFSCQIVVDRPHDGEYEVSDGDALYYGATFREALDEAMKGETDESRTKD